MVSVDFCYLTIKLPYNVLYGACVCSKNYEETRFTLNRASYNEKSKKTNVQGENHNKKASAKEALLS